MYYICVAFSELRKQFLIVIYEITLENSRHYLNAFHSRMIFTSTVILLWMFGLMIHYIFSPSVTHVTSNNDFYGEMLSWLDLVQLVAILFIFVGCFIHDGKYAVFVNGMISHDGCARSQNNLLQLHQHWNDIYFERERERLLGFTPTFLHKQSGKKTDMTDDMKEDDEKYPRRAVVSLNSIDSQSTNISNTEYHEMSESTDWNEVERRDDGELKGAMNLLLGKSVSDSFVHGPSKYFPSFYE